MKFPRSNDPSAGSGSLLRFIGEQYTIKFFPKTFRIRNPNVAILCMILGGYSVQITEEAASDALSDSNPRQPLPAQLEGLAKAGQAWGLVTGAVTMPLEFALAGSVPVVVSVQSFPEQPPSLVVIWNKVGGLYQVLDPMTGRRWLTAPALQEEMRLAVEPWSVSAWWDAMQSDAMRTHLSNRLRQLGIGETSAASLVTNAYANGQKWARCDAAVRLVSELVAQSELKKGDEAERLLLYFLEPDKLGTVPESDAKPDAKSDSETQSEAALRDIPASYWSIQPTEEPETILFKGVIGLPILGCTQSTPSLEPEETKEPKRPNPLLAPLRMMWEYAREEGLTNPGIIITAMTVAAFGVFLEAIILEGLMDLGLKLSSASERTTAMVLLGLFILVLFLLEWSIGEQTRRLGRRLDLRLRQTVFTIFPQLSEQYFQELSPAELVDRVYNVQSVTVFPTDASLFVSKAAKLVFITIGIATIDWIIAPLNLVALWLTWQSLMTILQSLYRENYRTQTMLGWLSVLYIDALRGRSAIWSHGAEAVMQHEYQQGLINYGFAFLNFHRLVLVVRTTAELILVVNITFQLWLYMVRGGEVVHLLLLFYWLQDFNQQIINIILDLLTSMGHMAKAARFGAILRAPREQTLTMAGEQAEEAKDLEKEQASGGIRIDLQNVVVRHGKQTILSDLNLTIAPGEHLAIVGSSGAGKSTMVGLLLGRYYPAEGRLLVDGIPLTYPRLQRLRRQIAWVDPNVQIWDRSLLYNLRYGTTGTDITELLDHIIEQADLVSVLERLPRGLSSQLGESGRSISGGQGQRVRFGRAMQRADARFVILDEAFRGLDRDKRKLLLKRAREYWKDTTLVCVTHDVSQTLSFPRVLVMEGGKIVEDDVPATLYAKSDSRYRLLLDEEEMVRIRMWESDTWRRLWLADGQLSEKESRQSNKG